MDDIFPQTLGDLLWQLTHNPLLLGPLAAALAGVLIRLYQQRWPTPPLSSNAARWVALAVALGLALGAYATRAVRGEVVFNADGVYALGLWVATIAGGSQGTYSAYKTLKARRPPPSPPAPGNE